MPVGALMLGKRRDPFHKAVHIRLSDVGPVDLVEDLLCLCDSLRVLQFLQGVEGVLSQGLDIGGGSLKLPYQSTHALSSPRSDAVLCSYLKDDVPQFPVCLGKEVLASPLSTSIDIFQKGSEFVDEPVDVCLCNGPWDIVNEALAHQFHDVSPDHVHKVQGGKGGMREEDTGIGPGGRIARPPIGLDRTIVFSSQPCHMLVEDHLPPVTIFPDLILLRFGKGILCHCQLSQSCAGIVQ
ncbi:MAG: hypothetical protein ACTSYL_06260 [Candidatus Thorarchaeota archaeon]